MNDDRAAEGIDHLQAAAKEMISAARAFLDVVEELVEDKDAVASVVSAVGSVAHGAAEAVRAGTGVRSSDLDHLDDIEHDGVQHIRVS